MNTQRLAMIGFGEAARAFAVARLAPIRAYDRDLLLSDQRHAKLAEIAAAGVEAVGSNAAATNGATLILSLVTADQALAAAAETAASIAPGTLFCDMNSVAPGTKRAAALLIEKAGGRYVDVAVMAPVEPLRRRAPLLVSGPHADGAVVALLAAGFADLRVVGGGIGSASAVKMVRSVMVKGIEALSAECALAAEAAGVRGEVIASLDASWPGADWGRRFDYNLDRMMVHGRRRADELDEVVRTLDALGAGAPMSRGTAAWQRAIGDLAMTSPEGLDAKLAALLPTLKHPTLEEAE